ncbi:MAG: hypothetical protein J6W52_12050 [Bacteroidaceae bacterium]|nr:hypothetical protein [Bacteroidaceae bacterium]
MKKLVLLLTLLSCLSSFGQGYKVYKSDGKVDAFPGETVTSVTLNDDSLRYEGHEYVDLGLPSGTRWATMNVGAEKYYQDGMHFSFQRAGTEGQWGGDWRLPSIAEYQELLKACQWEWTKVLNSQGYLVTGPNGNQLFLPAAGHIGFDDSFMDGLSGLRGSYWTIEGYSFAFSPEVKGLAGNSQTLQFSLRPVIGGSMLQDVRSEVLQDDAHEYVDLGLSVLWATTNIGAATPEDLGSYFGPGFTEPMPEEYPSLSYYSQEEWYINHCPYFVNGEAISSYMDYYYLQNDRTAEYEAWSQQSRLCSPLYIYNNRLDEMGYWILPEHDAATVLWGDGWRMPTLSEYRELIENTTKKSATVFQGPNGNTMNLPRAGYYSISDGRFTSDYFYLTSSITDNYPCIVDASSRNLQYSYNNASQYFLPIRPVKDRPKEGLTDKTTIARQEMVDLGLSVLWANCNWGAATPKDKGEYVAWGETFPKAAYTGANYHQAGYSQLNTKAMLGKLNWTLPTAAEVQELINKCTWAREAEGYRVTGPNGNSIFLPYTGFREGSSLSYADAGFYWTADSVQALRLDSDGTPAVKEATGYFGMAIRPVMNPNCPETGDALIIDGNYWNAVSITCKARGSYTDYGIQFSYVENMDNKVSGAWRMNIYTLGATVQNDEYTVQNLPVHPNTTYYYRAYAVMEDGITLYGDIKQFHTTDVVPAVDLGLSVKWASMNLGATSERDLADWYIHPSYYIEPYTGQLPATLDGRLKYNFLALQTTWGDEWRMPTEAEFQELIDKCTWEWQSEGSYDPNDWQGYVCGYKVTGPNGNSIFLRAEGVYNVMEQMPSGMGEVGYYWTQTPSEKHAGCYNIFKMTSTDRKIYFGLVGSEYNIRPVKK